MTRKSLDFASLDEFKTRKPKSTTQRVERTSPQRPPKAASAPTERAWESREAPTEGQFNIRAPFETIERFKQLCKDDRRTYAAMLEILMDRPEK